MRALPILAAATTTVAIAGCLAAPTGMSNAWPAADVDIVAIATGDLDSTSGSDLVALSVGDSSAGGGLYFMSGGTDFVTASAAPVSSFTTYQPISIAAPAALAVVDAHGTPTMIVASATGGQLEVRAYTGGELTQTADLRGLGAVTADAPMWIQTAEFPGSHLHVLVGQGTTLAHIDASSGPVLPAAQMLPVTGSGPLLAATGFMVDANTFGYAVSTGAEVSTGTIAVGASPGSAAPSSSWGTAATIAQNVQTLGSTLLIAGVTSTSPAELCVVDPGTGSSGACTSADPMAITSADTVTILFGDLLGASASAIVVVGGAQMSAMYGFPALTYVGTTGAATLAIEPPGGMTTGPQAALAGYKQAVAVPASNGVFIMSSDGTNQCANFSSSAGGTATVACD